MMSRGRTLLEWESVQRRFPWGIILLMGGGFALAQGAHTSCLSHLLGNLHCTALYCAVLYCTVLYFTHSHGDVTGRQLELLSALPAPAILVLVCLVTSATSQIASNSTTTSMMVNI